MGATLILILVATGGIILGILVGRYYVPDDRMLKRTAGHARAYIRAVSHLLAREPEAAESELKEVIRDNVDDIEPYFALAALFRSRGEWERAIRVHQAIAVREGQSKRVRLRAFYELGQDYRRAGMPRRATRAMEECLAEDSRHEGALRALAGLYEEQGRFADAAETWRRLTKLRSGEVAIRQHHLLVAAAQRALEQGDLDSARQLLRDAQRQDQHSAHGLVCAAELAAARGKLDRAVARLEQALGTAPELARVLVPGLFQAHRQLCEAAWRAQQERGGASNPADAPGDHGADPGDGRTAGADHDASPDELIDERAARATVASLEGVRASAGDNGHIELSIAELRSHYDPAAALADYRRAAERNPVLLPARIAAARLALAGGDAKDIARELEALAGQDGVLSWATNGSWRCGHCGHRQEALFWRCDGCRRWGTVRLDVGRAVLDAPPPPPRERRELPRGGVHMALLGARSVHALPEPSVASGLSAEELAQAGRRPSMLGRVSGWVSGAWSGLRGSSKEIQDAENKQESEIPRLPPASR